MKERRNRNKKIKDKKWVLWRQLAQSGCLWSYSKNPERFDDNLLIETTAVALTKAKMAFAYRILRVSNSDLLVTGHSQNVFTSIATGKITRLSEKYYKKLAAAMEKETAGN